MKTSHIVIICVTVFLLLALWLSYKAMVLTVEKKEKEETNKQRATGVILPNEWEGCTGYYASEILKKN